MTDFSVHAGSLLMLNIILVLVPFRSWFISDVSEDHIASIIITYECPKACSTLKINVFWDVAPCSFVEIYGRFRGAYFLHLQGDKTSKTPDNFYETTRHSIPEQNSTSYSPP
jgi:hypothetical protein